MIGRAEMRVSKNQVAFRRRTVFAVVWMPGIYLDDQAAPVVLTLGLRRKDTSARWKQTVEPRPGRFTHHLELRAVSEVDAKVRDWLKEAWTAAG